MSKKMKKNRELKKWNGRSHGHKWAGYGFAVAAYSQQQAADLVSKASELHVTVREIREYYSPCWGNNMAGITPTRPGLWAQERWKIGKPIKVL